MNVLANDQYWRYAERLDEDDAQLEALLDAEAYLTDSKGGLKRLISREMFALYIESGLKDEVMNSACDEWVSEATARAMVYGCSDKSEELGE